MKKVVSLLLITVMLLSSLCVSADTALSEDMQKALIRVKTLVDVPSELDEFSSFVTTNGDKKGYSFEWRNKDYSKSMSVSCDSEGRITSYYNYSVQDSDKKISKVSKQEIIDFANSFLRKTVPDAFVSATDTFVYDEKSYNARGNLRYSLEFDRYRNSLPVKDNYANISLGIKDDKIYVRNMSVNFEYDAQFDDGEIIENFVEMYKEKFPVEMVYCDEYNYNKTNAGEPNRKSVLIYRIKDNNSGYISLKDGEIVAEDSKYELYREENAVMDSLTAGGSSANKEMLTEQEIKELSHIEGLLSIEKIESTLKALPYINFTSSLKLSASNLTKNEEGEYFYRLQYRTQDDKQYRFLNAVVNAKNATLISLTNNGGYDTASDITLTEKQKKSAEEKALSFINKVAPERLSECEKASSESYGNIVNSSYVRMVNDVRYIDNGIDVAFDAKNNIVTSYRSDFYDTQFADVNSAIDETAAYEKILEYSPVTPMYILRGGKYIKAATLQKYGVSIDALSGEVRNVYEDSNTSFSYSDIKGHWVEEAATKLSEIQIGISGGVLNPEGEISQADFFRIMCSGIIDKYYNSYNEEELYERLIYDKIIDETQKAPQQAITRENAFIYIIRLAGLEKVAKLADIYKVKYTDGSNLADSNLGYAAILSGLGVICGDGGNLRPQDNLTRAESVIMLYRYLLSL